MPVSTIEKVVEKGERAGDLLGRFEFNKHQWVRFRVLMQKMEQSLSKMNTTMRGNAIYSDLLESESDFNFDGYPYRYEDADWRKNAAERLKKIGAAIHEWNDLMMFDGDPPLVPEPVLRVTPEL